MISNKGVVLRRLEDTKHWLGQPVTEEEEDEEDGDEEEAHLDVRQVKASSSKSRKRPPPGDSSDEEDGYPSVGESNYVPPPPVPATRNSANINPAPKRQRTASGSRDIAASRHEPSRNLPSSDLASKQSQRVMSIDLVLLLTVIQ